MSNLLLPFLTFSALLFASVDSNAITDSQAVGYLLRFGHAPPSDPRKGNLMSQQDLAEAVMSFQRFAGLEMTGTLDRATLEKMSAKRCGNTDRAGTDIARKRRYALQGSTWKKNHLTYKITKYTGDLAEHQVNTQVRHAFKWWSDQSQLTFQQVAPEGRADIEIKFVAGSHGDGDPFDGPGQTLAHAYFPQFGGDAHFDEAETWKITSAPNGVNLKIVAAHEFGHSLGLSHSDVNQALMAPFYNPKSTGLHSDDIQAIQHLYGPSVEKPGSMTTKKPRVTTTTRRVVTRPPVTTTTTTRSPPVGACNGRFDAMTRLNNGSTYAFLNQQFWRLNDQGADKGFPQNTEAVWGIRGKIDAALTFEQHTDIFQNHRVYRFSGGRPVRGYPLHISTVYEGIPSNIDAAFVWSGNGKVYFMKGDKYWRYNPGMMRADPGYPKSIAVWKGLPRTGVSASLQWNKRTYFFANGMYFRFDDERIQVAQSTKYPYPRRADEWWLGCKDNTLMANRAGTTTMDPGNSAPSITSHLLVAISSVVISLYAAML